MENYVEDEFSWPLGESYHKLQVTLREVLGMSWGEFSQLV
jgi:hypothetical protein